jgi:succinate dehydrogenase/fumarate reductase-like Fe-S protein
LPSTAFDGVVGTPPNATNRRRRRKLSIIRRVLLRVNMEKENETRTTPNRGIECGCCVAGCGTARMWEDFVGAVALNKIARFRLDPRDRLNDHDYYELIGDDDGVFGCMSLLACHELCPKNLLLASKIAYLRRRMVSVGVEITFDSGLQRLRQLRQRRII